MGCIVVWRNGSMAAYGIWYNGGKAALPPCAGRWCRCRGCPCPGRGGRRETGCRPQSPPAPSGRARQAPWPGQWSHPPHPAIAHPSTPHTPCPSTSSPPTPCPSTPLAPGGGGWTGRVCRWTPRTGSPTPRPYPTWGGLERGKEG